MNTVLLAAVPSARGEGTREGEQLLFSVTDDGTGFDPAAAPGAKDGHFGLEGVLAANDLAGQQVVSACEDAKLDVPREVAILSVDNNEELCENLTPPLSSIQMTTETAGYEAARFLDRVMRHSKRKRQKPRRFYYAFFHVAEWQTSSLRTFALLVVPEGNSTSVFRPR